MLTSFLLPFCGEIKLCTRIDVYIIFHTHIISEPVCKVVGTFLDDGCGGVERRTVVVGNDASVAMRCCADA